MDSGAWWATVHGVAKSRTRLSDFTSWTVALQAPLSVEFSKQEYWSELPFPPPGDLPGPGIKPMSLLSPALTGGFLPLALPSHIQSLGKKKKKLLCLVKYQMHRMISMVLKELFPVYKNHLQNIQNFLVFIN